MTGDWPEPDRHPEGLRLRLSSQVHQGRNVGAKESGWDILNEPDRRVMSGGHKCRGTDYQLFVKGAVRGERYDRSCPVIAARAILRRNRQPQPPAGAGDQSRETGTRLASLKQSVIPENVIGSVLVHADERRARNEPRRPVRCDGHCSGHKPLGKFQVGHDGVLREPPKPSSLVFPEQDRPVRCRDEAPGTERGPQGDGLDSAGRFYDL
ncbi:MAG: hypothetical protein QOC81_2774 [Thermoanaerobaculia bacterium]|nr:hypothetical protein [Thermoanaerobaculia bacterium]